MTDDEIRQIARSLIRGADYFRHLNYYPAERIVPMHLATIDLVRFTPADRETLDAMVAPHAVEVSNWPGIETVLEHVPNADVPALVRSLLVSSPYSITIRTRGTHCDVTMVDR